MRQTHTHRLQKCGQLMKAVNLDALLLTKPSNMFYLTGDGRLYAYAMITPEGKVALGVPQTDVEDVKNLARSSPSEIADCTPAPGGSGWKIL